MTLNSNEKATLGYIQDNLINGYIPAEKVIHATDIQTGTHILTRQEILFALSSLVQKNILNYTGINEELLHVLSSQIPQS